MNPERWTRIDDLFYAALELEPVARTAFLAKACGDDTSLRLEVEALLAADAKASSFLEATRAPKAPLASGRRLGRYEIVALLGAGGMGEVYRARDARLGRDVAIKVVLPAASGPEEKTRLQREARAAGALNHPNILAVYDVGEDDGIFYIVSELLEGQTLRARLASGPPLPIPRCLDFARQICRGLSVAHEKGIVHRDINPGNLFITTDSSIKILDFGLAKRFRGGLPADAATQSLTKPGMVLGTVGYMSPEQAQGDPVGSPSDLFSFGAVLYEMLSGRRPFGAGSALKVLHATVSDEPPPLGDAFPPALARLVGRCLAKDPSARFQSAHQLCDALGEIVGPVGGEAPLYRDLLGADSTKLATRPEEQMAPPSDRRGSDPLKLSTGQAETPPLSQAPRPARHYAGRTAIAAAVVAATIALVFVLRRHDATAPNPLADAPSLAVLPFDSLGATKDDEYFAAGIHSELIAQLAQVSGLRVIARTSVLSYRNTARGAREIAKELGVGAILEGSVQRAGNRVRVTANLIDAQTERDLWAERYDRDLADLFAIQTEIAQDIAGKLGARLTSDERARLSRPPTRSPEAYDHYLRGLDYWQRSIWDVDGLRLAAVAFEKAASADPSFALAHARLGIAWTELSFMEVDSEPTLKAKTKVEIDRALALQPDLPEARFALGHYFYHLRDFGTALREYENALRGAPGNAEFISNTGSVARRQGRWDEALARFASAASLDPRFREPQEHLADTLSKLRRYSEAQRACGRLTALAPELQAVLALCAFLPSKQDGDTAPAGVFLSQLRQTSFYSFGPPGIFFERVLGLHPKRALEVLEAPHFEEIALRAPFRPRALLRARAYVALGESERARQEFVAARQLSLAEVARNPEDPHRLSALAESLAGLGEHEESLRMARRAVAMRPMESDAYEGPQLLEDFAAVAAATGNTDDALAALERLLVVPSDLSEALLRVDPRWAPLRGNARFEALITLKVH